jgi:hypothetical protein
MKTITSNNKADELLSGRTETLVAQLGELTETQCRVLLTREKKTRKRPHVIERLAGRIVALERERLVQR